MAGRFFERIAALCTRLPVQSVAKMANMSWDTVARVDKHAIDLALPELEDRLQGLRWMGVDDANLPLARTIVPRGSLALRSLPRQFFCRRS